MEKFCRKYRPGELRMIVQGFWDGLTPPQFYLREILVEHGLMEFKEATAYLKQLGAEAAPDMLLALQTDVDVQMAFIEQRWKNAPPLVPKALTA